MSLILFLIDLKKNSFVIISRAYKLKSTIDSQTIIYSYRHLFLLLHIIVFCTLKLLKLVIYYYYSLIIYWVMLILYCHSHNNNKKEEKEDGLLNLKIVSCDNVPWKNELDKGFNTLSSIAGAKFILYWILTVITNNHQRPTTPWICIICIKNLQPTTILFELLLY